MSDQGQTGTLESGYGTFGNQLSEDSVVAIEDESVEILDAEGDKVGSACIFASSS
jgi:hypothetical protein